MSSWNIEEGFFSDGLTKFPILLLLDAGEKG